MTATPIAPPAEQLNAAAYRRAHWGKLMIIRREDGVAPTTGDFFRVDSVGTHPTGLLVTGIFEGDRRSHLMASAVRDASHSEIAWLQARQN